MIQTVNVNVAAQPTSGGPESYLVLSQNENGRQIRFRILGDDLPAGCTATFSGTKPDGNVYSASGTIDGNFVLLDEEIQMTAVAGRWDAKLSIAKGTENIMTSLIRVTVVADAVSGDSIPSDSELDGIVAECRSYAEAAKNEAYGSPLTASTAAAMTDQSRVYVYTGSESGMTAGHWYYYNGTAWADGGIYNAVAVDTDTTLSIAGKAADAKKVGDELASVKEDFNNMVNSAYVTDSASGSVAHFTDGAENVHMKSVVIDTASASATVTRTGKNLLPHDKGSYTSGPLTFTLQSDGGIKIVGTSTDIRNYSCYDDITTMNLKAGVEYRAILTGSGAGYVQGGGNAGSVKFQLYVDGNSTFIEQDKTFTIPDTATSSYLRLRCPPLTYDCVVYPLLILASETDTAYEPYNGNTYDVTLVDGVVQEEINSLLGINNVWSDSGDVDVEYRADTKLYIDKRLGV